MNVEIFEIRDLGGGQFSLGLRSLGKVTSYVVTLSDAPVVGVSGPHSFWNLLRGNKTATSEILKVLIGIQQGDAVELPKQLSIEDNEFKDLSGEVPLWASRTAAWFLSSDSLKWASKHLTTRGSNTLFPVPFEHKLIGANVDNFTALVSRMNICEHEVRNFRQLWVPKSTAGRRSAVQLDPLDAFVLAAITYELGEIVETIRVPPSEAIVFSFRFQPDEEGEIWDKHTNYDLFQECTLDWLLRPDTSVVAETDIAAFYHTLKPSIVSAHLERCGVPRKQAEALNRLLESVDDEGLPVGPSFAALLAETVLAPIDQHLLSSGLKFVRFNDDYRFFCGNEIEAHSALQVLADALLETAGLRMQESKTKISNKDDVIERIQGDWLTHLYAEDDDEEEKNRRLLDSARTVLEKSVDNSHVAWVRLFREAFSALPLEDKRDVLPLVLQHLARVWGVAPQVSKSLEALLPGTEGGRELLNLVCDQLTNQINSLPDYATSWILHAFWRNEWQGKEAFANLGTMLTSQQSATRRELLIALKKTDSADSVSYDPHNPWQSRAHVWATERHKTLPLETESSSFRRLWAQVLYESIVDGDIVG